jgi:signal transduction histidine kinase
MTMILRLGVVLFFFTLIFSCFAGNKTPDENINVYLQKAEPLINTDNQAAKIFLDSASFLLEQNNTEALYSEYCYLLSYYYLSNSEISKAIEYSFQAYDYYKNTGNYKRIADCHFVMGKSHIRLAGYMEGIAELFTASALYDSLGLKKEWILTQNNIGNGYFHMRDFNKAKEFYNQVNAYAGQNFDTTMLVKSYNNLGNVCDEMGEKGSDEAVKYYQKAIEVSKLTGLKPELISFYTNMGLDYIKQGQLDSAFTSLCMAKNLSHRFDNNYALLALYLNFGTYYNAIKQYDSALYYIEQTNLLQKKLNSKVWLKKLLNIKTQVLKNQGNYPEAVKVMEESLHWQDSLYNEEISSMGSEMKARFENQKKVQQFEMQQKELNTRKLQERLMFVVLVLLVLLILLSVFFLWKIKAANKSLQNKNEVIKQANEELKEALDTRDKLMSVIAHDIKNPLNSIIGFAEMGFNSRNITIEKMRLYNEQIFKSSKSLYELLDNLLTWIKSQGGLRIAIKEFALHELINDNIDLLHHMAIEKEIDLQKECDPDIRINADHYTIYTVVRNILTNAIKFTEPGGRIKVSGFEKDDHVVIRIEDNGVGISPENIKKLFDPRADRNKLSNSSNQGTGLGLLLCDDFIKLNNGYIDVTSQEGNGSCFSIYVPKGKK